MSKEGGILARYLTHLATLDAHNQNPQVIKRTGGIFSSGFLLDGTVALVASTLYGVITEIPRDITIDQLVIEVTTKVDATAARIGIYEVGTNLYPGALLLDGGAVSTAAVAVVTATVDKKVPKGVYFMAILSNGAATLRRVTGSARQDQILGVNPASLSSGYIGWSVSQAYGALPDPFTAGGALIAAGAEACYRILSLD